MLWYFSDHVCNQWSFMTNPYKKKVLSISQIIMKKKVISLSVIGNINPEEWGFLIYESILPENKMWEDKKTIFDYKYSVLTSTLYLKLLLSFFCFF